MERLNFHLHSDVTMSLPHLRLLPDKTLSKCRTIIISCSTFTNRLFSFHLPPVLHCEFLFIAGDGKLCISGKLPDWNVAVRQMHNCHFPPLATFHRPNVAVSPKIANFLFNFECQLLFNRVKISLFWMEFSKISEIWLKVSAALESQGKSSFNLAAAQEIYSASTVSLAKKAALQKAQKSDMYLLLSSSHLSAGQSVVKIPANLAKSTDGHQVSLTPLEMWQWVQMADLIKAGFRIVSFVSETQIHQLWWHLPPVHHSIDYFSFFFKFSNIIFLKNFFI